MIKFPVNDLLSSLKYLEVIKNHYDKNPDSLAKIDSNSNKLEIDLLSQTLEKLAYLFSNLTLHGLAAECGTCFLGFDLNREKQFAKVVPQIGEICSRISYEMYSLECFAIATHLKKYYDKPALFGQKVNESFPSAVNDIKLAGTCISLGLNTAAVFHLMRVSEFALKTFARRLKVDKSQLKKPVDQSMWGEILSNAEKNIRDIKNSKTHHTPKGLKVLEFYQEVQLELVSMKDVWRNRVSHARSNYSSEEAIKIYDRVKDFMMKLAERISEPKKRKPRK